MTNENNNLTIFRSLNSRWNLSCCNKLHSYKKKGKKDERKIQGPVTMVAGSPWWRAERKESFAAQIKMRSGQAGRHSLKSFSRCRRPRNSYEYCPRTIAWFTVTACTVSGQRALRIWNQRTHLVTVSRTRNDIHGTVARKRRLGESHAL